MINNNLLMKIVAHNSYLLGFGIIIGESVQRGFDYWSINVTTYIEDYFAGIFLIVAAICWFRSSEYAEKLMVAAYAYASGMTATAFFMHFEAFLRGHSMVDYQQYDDTGVIITKAYALVTMLACLIVSIRFKNPENMG